jgi:hypothetical protein
MDDIVPALLKSIQNDLNRRMKANSQIAITLDSIVKGSQKYTDAMNFADDLGKALADSVVNGLADGVLPDDTIYYNIAKRLIEELGGNAFDMAEEAALQVQKNINDGAKNV